MSGTELQRIEVLAEVVSRRRTEASAAAILGISTRQTRRLIVAYRASGGASVIHKARGRVSNNKTLEGIREYAVELVRANYADFGPSLAAEMLLSKHDLRVSRETLRKWFEDRGDACTLLVFIDDATSRLVYLQFVRSESTDTYLSAVHAYVRAYGCPVAFYSDKHTVFRINRSSAPGGTGMTQFGRALAELNIEIICANSSQAKGRVERVNRTLQDRLVKELRLAGISSIEAGNAYLPRFRPSHNERFAVTPLRADDKHRPLSISVDKLTDILCHREQRYVGNQLTLTYDRKRIILERNATSEDLGGKYVDVYDFPDGRLEVRSKGLLLPYRVFSKDQRVSHTAIVENKRLSHALTIIKAQQDLKDQPKVQTNSEKGGYKKNPRQPYGPDYKAKIAAAPAVEMTA